MNECELYDSEKDLYLSFPSMKISRENSSSCVFKASKDHKGNQVRIGVWIYVFGGFDKKPIDDIERVKITFGK